MEMLFRLATTCFGSDKGWGHCKVTEVKMVSGREGAVNTRGTEGSGHHGVNEMKS